MVLNGESKKPFITESNLNVASFDGNALVGHSAEATKEVFAKVATEKGVKRVVVGGKRPLRPLSLGKEFAFDLEGDSALLIDGFNGKEYQLFMNGKDIKDKGRRSKLDAEIKEVNIQPYVQAGRNLVAIKLVATRRTDGILDLLKIVGDFALENMADRYVIVEKKRAMKVGDWTKQGYPFYSGTGIYRTEIDVPAKYIGGKLFLEVDCGDDLLEVSVNGSSGRVVPWHP